MDAVPHGNFMIASNEVALIGDDTIKSRILTIRGVQVLLDRDLAMLYGVETKVLNQAVKRNIARFPDSFMFQLSREEMENWKSQFVTSNLSNEDEAGLRMGLRRPPYAFTEQGIAMLSAVLRSATAITSTAVAKFNKQNPTLTVKATGVFHDRFLILDETELYHFGASLKDLGRHYCAVSKMDAMFIPSIMQRI